VCLSYPTTHDLIKSTLIKKPQYTKEFNMKFELPALPYAYDALEPHIDALTMEIHHTKHHQTYINNLNAALEKHPELQGKSLDELVRSPNALPDDIRTAVRNNGGGHYNHSIFWTVMSPNGGGEPKGDLGNAIASAFGDFSKFKETFSQAAITRFGSGWAWLGLKESKLQVISLPNQDAPLMEGLIPLMGIDVWEHAYYLKYQNRRPDYVASWWNIVNWEEVTRRYEESK
jgi:superoxide dismutase, Fe-Mn family